MEITRHGEAQQTNGQAPQIGHVIPAFSLQRADGSKLTNADLDAAHTLISVVPDITTRVCSISTKEFNKSVDQFKDVRFLTVSTNTTEQQQYWCAAEGVQSIELVSDADGEFGRSMGLYVDGNNTDARSVWILDQDGKIVYREIIKEQSDEPDYSSALAYLEAHQH
ncbi:MAG: peroxiredoxin [Lacticaseibacillus songhuajiangensis]|jgi:thiol peroxidase|nr:peroxiredoxin [Lacticaseibacillus songhuajiangensis]